MRELPTRLDDVETSTGIWSFVAVLIWIGPIYLNLVVAAAALVALLSGKACVVAATVLALQAALAVLPAYPIPDVGNRLSSWIARAAHGYFPIETLVEDSEAFDERRTYIVGLEPHSVLPLSILAFHPSGTLRGALGRVRVAALATPVVFRFPIIRHLWAWLGLQSVDRGNILRLLKGGTSVVLIPGGVAECLHMRDGAEVVFLQKRLGFVKLALQTGSELVPAFTFGQSTIWRYYKPPRAVLAAVSRAVGIAPLAFWGRWGTPMPYPRRMLTVVGRPIPVTQDAEPSREAVAAAHVRFVEEMKALFERHKKGAGFPDLQLVVL